MIEDVSGEEFGGVVQMSDSMLEIYLNTVGLRYHYHHGFIYVFKMLKSVGEHLKGKTRSHTNCMGSS